MEEIESTKIAAVWTSVGSRSSSMGVGRMVKQEWRRRCLHDK